MECKACNGKGYYFSYETPLDTEKQQFTCEICVGDGFIDLEGR